MASGLQPEGTGEDEDDEERAQFARDILVHNEQVKLTANLMNIGAAGFTITGIVAPLTAAMATTGRVTAPALMLMAVWFVLGVGLHFGARLTLTNLR
ncbi:hypothetical protein [Methylobacterium sp. 17Sr1-1]|uniref:hypothetical protein n=1 Tax=Methylobacterium sp. 17Sr1-1 TaxID=2202826 RepID=UPI000D7041D2|nr:hypothetical protein [Methylobacterium sp. 17Sr1-1]AWN52389.1 hypothetical protein DK412_12595 [Methylobacterium sp. 17Sr1-1]